ncbi:MAG: response regulator [Paracoccus sp. (in: a-proteobacteria)]|jgi:two-component system phosphate regulon response regulator OmpR|uniref:response regulator n=1 Tax=unclassified Paracoccus (in: a-proteobacteria) TaxID=2688777 RepID=UPI000C584194|nr:MULTISPECIES: response regulator [unclassified Paracoccus (in: a-proteobacteria)]MAN55974.1 DNA-binding response regulator [Paracoccus sp. (in: a-proteobacteria)]MBA47704.1 DNA-binding response regulator [Paracoccus sp. (in: a-proteobacteria)]|tara:strand:- start:128 stop:835 length:708 start_codon:yes stop_codon:yes gene_type:complete
MTHPAAHLLIVDDDERIRALLGKFLRKNDFMVTMARDATQARRLLAGLEFDLIVLDVMMPGEDGISLTRSLRGALDTPILLLTARGETEDRIAGLESGADDYLAKPFEPRELLLRIAAILRRVPAAEASQPKFLTLGMLRYDTDKGELWQGDAPLRLTGTEQSLLRRLAARAGQPVSRSDLIEDLGRSGNGDEAENSERAIDVQITRLRRKIEPDPKEPRFLQTVRGTGYMLVCD